MDLDKVDDYLSTHAGRDKFLKALCYGLKFVTCLTKDTEKTTKCQLLSSELSNCRAILRFLDYVPVINDFRTNGLGLNEPDWCLRCINVANAIIGPVFYPLEQIAWAAEKSLLKVNGKPWSDASTVCWVASLYLDLFKYLRTLNLLQNYKSSVKVVDETSRLAVEKLSLQQRNLLFLSVRTACDLTYAIHYLPEGFLWSTKLETWQVGALGMVSAAISISQALGKMAK